MKSYGKVVAVFGAYRPTPGDPEYEKAVDLGRQIASAGWTLLNGGYDGTMEGGARGARERGGRVIGVTVEVYSRHPNRFTTETILTRDLWERLRTMLERSNAFIALPGSTGTLAEVAMAWEFIEKKLMPPKPLILLGEFWAPFYRMFAPEAHGAPSRRNLVRVEPTVGEAIDFLQRYWKE